MAETYTMRGLDPLFWRKVKIHAAQKGVTVKQLICNLLAKAIGL